MIITNSDTSEFASFFSPVINNEGTIAFGALLDDGGIGVFKNTGAVTRIADSSGPFRYFYATAINNKGTVAFWADLDPGPFGIYTGPDVVADKVIQTGDPLFGSTVKGLSFGSKGLNDQGEVAFWAALADGREVIVRASPLGANK
jgi:hypothetical protein